MITEWACVGVFLVALACGCSGRPEAPLELRAPTLAEAFAPGAVPEHASLVLRTDAGPIRCTADVAGAPRAAALVVGLARGHAVWKDPRTRELTKRPLYRDLEFSRVIEGALVQTGCPIGDNTGHPGYRLPVELGPDDAQRLARPGALVLARYTPPPGRTDPKPPPPGDVMGSQIAITLVPMPHLAGTVTVLGQCEDLDVVRRIAATRDRIMRARLQAIEVAEAH